MPMIARRSVRLWCDRQWAISSILAALCLCGAVWLVLFDRYMAGTLVGFLGACAAGAAVMAAWIGQRFRE